MVEDIIKDTIEEEKEKNDNTRKTLQFLTSEDSHKISTRKTNFSDEMCTNCKKKKAVKEGYCEECSKKIKTFST